MLAVTFDFRNIHNTDQFYQYLLMNSHCPAGFGCNLDALWDWLTGGIELPARFELNHLPEAGNTDLKPVIKLLAEAAAELSGLLQLRFNGHKHPDDDWQAVLFPPGSAPHH